MREAQALSIQLEDPGSERLGQAGAETASDSRFHERHGRVGERCDCARDLERRGADTIDACAQELVQIRRNRELLAGSERGALALKGTCKFKREERVAARGLPEPDQRRPRKRYAEPCP
jgi:hypothetical protein